MRISCVSGTVEGRLDSLKRLVQSIRSSVGDSEYEIILVACACSAHTHSWIESQPDCVLVKRPKKEGSVVAFDDGLPRARGEYVVVLNDDVRVDGGTLATAADFLDEHPEVGQVAFGHRYQNRRGDSTKPRIQRAYGYVYGQCCMTRKWLGDLVGWWDLKPNIGLVHYGGDTQFSLKIWELGYEVVGVSGCSVTDWEIEDETRQEWSHKPRAENGGVHPDLDKFQRYWRGRMPRPKNWRPANVNRVAIKAARGTLRTLQFKSAMGLGFPMRRTVIEAFREYGPAKQANQTWAMRHFGGRDSPAAQQWFLKVARQFDPDLIMLQAQRENNITVETLRRLKRSMPNVFVFNWDADTHYPMLDFHWKIAREADLMLTISPSLFPWYRSHGVHNIGYWPIGVQEEFIDVDRKAFQHPYDVTFLGTLYGEDSFPEALTRRDAVLRLARARDINLQLQGLGWHKAGLEATSTLESFAANAELYCRSKMALSISQTADYWGYTSDRAYNILATGCPVLIQKFPGIEEHGLIDGESCIAWDTLDEMMDKARYYKKATVEREAIGKAGREVLLARHTWKQRVKELIGLVSGMGGERCLGIE